MYAGPHHGVFLKKLERLGEFVSLEVERERFVYFDEKIEHASFLVGHSASSWPELVIQMLHVAQLISPGWKVIVGTRSLSGEAGPKANGTEGYQQKPSGMRLIKWEINEAQLYRRMRWLSGQPNRW